MPAEGASSPVKRKKKGKKSKAAHPAEESAEEQTGEHTEAQQELLALMAQLGECEQKCRQRYRAISGYTRERTTSESVSFGDLMQELASLEEKTVAALGNLDETEVAGLTPSIVTMLDAGSSDFFSGSRRLQGKAVMTAARKALCRKTGDEEEEGDGEEEDDEAPSSREGDSPKDITDPEPARRRPPSASMKEGQSCPPPGVVNTSSSSSSSSGSSNTTPAGQRKEKAGKADKGADKERKESDKEQDQHTVDKLVSAYASAGLIALCVQLWAPARDGDLQTLGRLLELDPWTVDEPGRAGQGFTNALQVACAGGNVQCVELLLKRGAIFRDSDWQPEPKPFVCSSMLVGAGYYDGGGAPRGILYFQPSRFPKRRIPRETYVMILDMLLEQVGVQ